VLSVTPSVDQSINQSVADGVTRLQPLDHSEVLLKFDEWFALKWSGLPADPRIASSNQVLYATYESWFASCQLPQVSQLPEESQHGANTVCAACPDHIQRSAGINVAHMSSLLRFRLGCHDLPVAVGRWGTRHITRESRVCDRCESGIVGDEFHMVFECSSYHAVRTHFSSLFEFCGGHGSLDSSITPASSHMKQFMCQNKRLVAAFVHTCWLLRCNPSLDVSLVFDPSESEIEVESDEILQADLAA
jgi:hypothetical protein